MKKWMSIAAIAVVGASATSFALRTQNQAIAKSVEKPLAAAVNFGQKVAPLPLQDTAGKPVTIAQWNKSKATVILFVATQCPVSNDYNTRMASLQKSYGSKGVRFIGINSNKAEAGAEVAAHTRENGFGFTVYKDAGNKIADRFAATVTPEVFVVGPKGDLLYKGRIDNSKNLAEVKDRSLQTALDAILTGKTIAKKETRAFGCSIKRES